MRNVPKRINNVKTSYVLIHITSPFRISHDGISAGRHDNERCFRKEGDCPLCNTIISLLHYHSIVLLAIFIFYPQTTILIQLIPNHLTQSRTSTSLHK